MDAQPRDCNVRAERIASELGITIDEAIEMRRQVERCQIMAPQRFVVVGRLELPRGQA